MADSSVWGGYFLITDETVILLRKANAKIDAANKENGRGTLNDYKLWCFNGEPKMTLVCTERFTGKGLREDFFDMEWKHLPIKRPGHSNSEYPIQKPCNYELMQKLAKSLSKNLPFVRIDFYEINSQIYFGEITFYPSSGFHGFVPAEWDELLGEWITLCK